MSILSATPAAVRAQRAADQVNNYGLFAHSAGNVFSVVSREGRVYETTATTCTCPDFQHRGSKQNPPVPCKHQHLVRTQAEQAARAAILRAEQAVAARQAQEAANADLQARLAAARNRIARDFPEDC